MASFASTILMVRPAAFSYNAETAVNNFFQSDPSFPKEELQQLVLEEFDEMVNVLTEKGINTIVIEDTEEPPKPDAIFPNNWLCSFPSGLLAVFPMFAMNRRAEKRDDILQWLAENYKVTDVQDWSEFEADARYLEGTGSMVIDHDNRLIFACLSPRTDASVLEKFATAINYTAFSFHAKDDRKRPIYHTNVMMCLGDGIAILCEEAIADETEKIALTHLIEMTGRDIIKINMQQLNAFGGNMLQLMNSDGKTFLVMSRTAYESLTSEQIKRIEAFTEILAIGVPVIEKVEGGSVRCMMAEIFFEER
jgi:hypothetical protein